MREIAGRTFFNWRGKDITTRAEEGALALRTQAHRFDVVRRRDSTGPAGQTFVGYGNRNGSAALAAGIKHLQLAVEFINYPALIVGAGPTHVPGLVVSYLSRLAAGNIIRVKIEVSIAIGLK